VFPITSPPLLNVDSEYLQTSFSESRSQGQADIAQADNTDTSSIGDSPLSGPRLLHLSNSISQNCQSAILCFSSTLSEERSATQATIPRHALPSPRGTHPFRHCEEPRQNGRRSNLQSLVSSLHSLISNLQSPITSHHSLVLWDRKTGGRIVEIITSDRYN